MKKKISFVVILVLAVGALILYKLYHETTPDIVDSKPERVTDVSTLINDFHSDSMAARKKYLDRVVEVTGIVKSIDTSGAIVLGNREDAASVVCGLDRRHMKDYEQVKVGSSAVIQGRCTGFEIAEEMLGINLGTTIQLSFAGVKQKNK